MITGDPDLGAMQIWLMGFAGLMLLPVLIAVGFSLWTATRPSAAGAAMTTLHFAYGANMSRAVMRKYAPGARALGRRARRPSLCHHRRRLCLGRAGARQTVHGVLWRITPRDRVMLNAWENVGGGLYRAETLAVRGSAGRAPALIYFARPGVEGRPKPGYIELVVAAARDWDLPEAYIHSLEGLASARPLGTDARKIGEFR